MTGKKLSARVSKLETLLDVRVELGRIYREGRREQLSTDRQRVLITNLNSLAAVIRDSDIETRLNVVEEKIKS
jgi:hypothetical protein